MLNDIEQKEALLERDNRRRDRYSRNACPFCGSENFEKWKSKEGNLTGTRCENHCLSSYMIDIEFLPFYVPRERAEEKREPRTLKHTSGKRH